MELLEYKFQQVTRMTIYDVIGIILLEAILEIIILYNLLVSNERVSTCFHFTSVTELI